MENEAEKFNRRRSKKAMRSLYKKMTDDELHDIYLKVIGLCINKTRDEMVDELVGYEGDFPEELFMDSDNESTLEERLWPVHHVFKGQKIKFLGDELVGLYDLGERGGDESQTVIIHDMMSMATPVEMGEIIKRAYDAIPAGGRVVLIENIITKKGIAMSFIRQLEVAGFEGVKFLTEIDLWGIIVGTKPGGDVKEDLPAPEVVETPVVEAPKDATIFEPDTENIEETPVETEPEPAPKPRKKRTNRKKKTA